MSKQIQNVISVLTFSWCVFSGNQLKAEEGNFRPSGVKLTSKIAIDSIRGETAAMMTEAGIDFPVLMQHALDGREVAVRLLFWASNNVGLDGAGADGFGHYLLPVAQKTGDAKLVKILSSIKDSGTLETIRFFLLDELGFGVPEAGADKKAVAAIKKLLPETWKHLNSIREQDAAGQSATAD